NHSSPLAAIAIVLIVLLIAIAAGYIVLGRRRKPHADAAGTDEESHIRAAVRARLAELLAAPAAAEPAAPAVAEPVETPGAHSYKVIESESMQLTNEFLGFRFFGAARDATPNVVPDPESGRMTELEIPPESEPLAELVSHEPAPQSEPVPLPAPEPESKQVAEFVSHEHEPAPQSEPVHAPESEREPEPEPASATDPDPVAPRLNALSTPAYVTRGGGRSEPKRVRVAAEPSADPAWLVSGFLRFCPASGEVWSGRMQVHLDPQEVAILQLLMTSGNRGVTRDDIITAGSLDPSGRDFAPLLARIKRKTGWRGQMVRRESVTVYVFDDDVEIDHEKSVGRRPARPPARR
ncbi:MAG: hypothetical protein QOG69_800, partial [Actinomycetota bacterium]|nr:hypothetical protein [Actinomycetota bacterium]